jgi:hypothetical protein
VKVTALMSFFDDPAEMIERAIRSAVPIIDALVAVDGAYATYPAGEARSPTVQVDTIRRVAADCEIDLLLYQPSDLWIGGEVEKRDFMFRLGDTTKPDWFVILDTDFVFEYPYRRGAEDVRADLRTAEKREFEVCNVTLIDHVAHPGANHKRRVETDLPLFYRVAGLAPIHIGPTHYHTTREGYDTHLWGCSNTPQLPHFDMTDTLHVKHEWWHRDENRQASKWGYYMVRDGQQLERNPFSQQLVAATAEED